MSEPKLTLTFADKLAANPGMAAQNPVDNSQGYQLVGPDSKPSRREKVAVIGTAPSSRDLAPYKDTSWEIWGCSPGNMNILPRVDAWFEIHGNLHWPPINAQYGDNYLKWLSQQPFPVYLQDEQHHKKYFAHGISFPKREILLHFGKWATYFFGSSFAWMTAYAIYKGYKEIGLWGVDMASKDEYIFQRQSFYFWTYLADQRGIKITIPLESDLGQRPSLYGFSEVKPYGRKMAARKQELLGRVQQFEQGELPKLTQQIEAAKQNTLYLKGAIEDNEYQTCIWPEPMVTADEAKELLELEGYKIIPPGQVLTAPVQPIPFTHAMYPQTTTPFVVTRMLTGETEPVRAQMDPPPVKANGAAEIPKAKRRRGRPKGSKNKRSESVAIT